MKMTNEQPSTDATNGNQNVTTHVSSESYPISQPLATILHEVSKIDSSSKATTTSAPPKTTTMSVLRENVEDALRSVIQNCFVAMDEMYFAT